MRGQKNGTPEEQAAWKEKIRHLPQHYKPGQSGNPAGRPKRKTPSEILYAFAMAEYGKHGPEQLKELQKRMPEPWRSKPIEKITVAEFVGWIHMMQAMRPAGWKDRAEFYDRTEGKPVQKIAVTEDPNADRRTRYDWRKLSTEELLKLKEIQLKAMVEEDKS
jgi:hypothetical protein